jgi:hypothetical protein
VREALKRLAAENLVLADPARGMIVHAPDAGEIEDVFVVREALDGLAARLAAHRITPSELSRLRLIVDTMRQAIQSDRREQIVIANQRFHDVIYAAAGNAMLARVASDLRDFVRRFTTLPFASPDRVEHVLAEHEDAHALVCLHHQPIPMLSRWLDEVGLEDASELLDVVARHDNVRGVLWGHVHQALDTFVGRVRFMSTPSTCTQFKPRDDAFGIDVRPPGYRVLDLAADGSIATEVVWLEGYAP